ncbi:hypothetical protein A2Y85_01820 [candidate division WOR-3 bacterium RBG_13_43_14]|uniref:Uncharacterized protein n=1 Tax=candidate division WOR-3 bacterium RBG_13_43_14 TaxID=1802590 RepID=A0A1F4UGK8_UNCW3|nr:MAG: hypothetical protein A2Y85_01820 [candidate division WOR-3 bacterium RBG_13_43_14]
MLTPEQQPGIIDIVEPCYRMVVIILLIALAIFLTFMPALANDFTNWDDPELITSNPRIGSVTPASILRIFARPQCGPYVPLTILSFAIENQLFGLNPLFFHLTNILFHITNVLLVFALMRFLLRNFWAAAVIALFFGLHPMRVESVAWVTERKDVLCGFFFFAAWFVFVRFRLYNRRLIHYVIPALYLLAIIAKPMALTLPAVLLLTEYFLDGRVRRTTIRLVLVMFVFALPFIAINFHTQIRQTDTPAFDLLRNMLLGSRNLITYAGKTIVPSGLSPFYPHPADFERSIPITCYFAPLVLAAAVVCMMWWRRRTRVPVFGGLFFLVTALPVSHLIPIAGPAMAADRYTYIPSIGIAFLIAFAGMWLWKKFTGRARVMKFGFGVITVAVLIVMAIYSHAFCRVWKNSLTLWNYVLQRYPDSSLALNNRGRAYCLLGQHARAIHDYERAVQLDPEYELPYYNRAVAYDKLQNYERALADFDRALAIKPDMAIAYAGRGATYNRLGRYQAAIAEFNHALSLDALLDVAYLDRGYAYFQMGFYERALADYESALAIDPNYPETYINRGDVWFVRGEFDRAITAYSQALKINPYFYTAYYNRAMAYRMIGENSFALTDYDQAIQLKPDFAEALNNRGNIYMSAAMYEKAIVDYSRALQVRPAYADAYYNRAMARHMIGEDRPAWDDIIRAEQLGFPVTPETKARLTPGP